jgi:kanosamine 6-kinase
MTLTWPTGGVERDLAALAAAVDRLVGSEPHGLRNVYAAGLALPATVAGDRIIAWPSRPSWSGLDLSAALSRVLPGVLTVYEDDGNLAALAEAEAAGCQNLAFLGIGTGVGGGIVLGGQLYSGPRGSAGEIGHLVIDRDGACCTCGRAGCLQAVASGSATLARAERERGRGLLHPAVFDAGLADGAPWAVGAFLETANALAAAVVNLGELLQCAQVRIGGGFGSGVPGLVEAVRGEVARLARSGQQPPMVLRAEHGADASLHGAILLARSAIGPAAARTEQVRLTMTGADHGC